jgi:hypothetical protein
MSLADVGRCNDTTCVYELLTLASARHMGVGLVILYQKLAMGATIDAPHNSERQPARCRL